MLGTVNLVGSPYTTSQLLPVMTGPSNVCLSLRYFRDAYDFTRPSPSPHGVVVRRVKGVYDSSKGKSEDGLSQKSLSFHEGLLLLLLTLLYLGFSGLSLRVKGNGRSCQSSEVLHAPEPLE